MKKSLLTASFLLSLITATMYAQLPTGTWFLGGDVNVSSSSTEYTQTTSTNKTTDKTTYAQFGVIPSFGYFIFENFSAGLGFGYSSTSYKDDYTSTPSSGPSSIQTRESTNKTWTINPSIRCYTPLSNKIYFFGELGASYGPGKTSLTTTFTSGGQSTTNDQTGTVTGVSAAIRPGFLYFISNRFGVEASFGSLGYSSTTTNSTTNQNETRTQKSSGFNVNLNLSSVSFGFKYYFAD